MASRWQDRWNNPNQAEMNHLNSASYGNSPSEASVGGHILKKVIISGAPGSGKGTQCELLRKRYKLTHISTGDLLRSRKNMMPELAQYMDNGQLVPDDTIVAIVKERLAQEDVASKGFILDGFPRTIAQAESMAEAGVKVDHFLYLDVQDDLIVKRIGGRRIDPLSGQIYHTEFNPAPTPEIEARLVIRTDDTEEKIKTRLVDFHNHNPALLAHYASITKRIDGGSNDPVVVFDTIAQELEGEAYLGQRLAAHAVAKAYHCGTAAVELVTISRWFDHARWTLLYSQARRHTSSSWNDKSRRQVRATEQTIWLKGRLMPYHTYRVETWVEKFRTTSVQMGHKIVDPSNGVTVATAKVVVKLQASDGSAEVFPDRDRVQRLVDSDSDVDQDPHQFFDAIDESTSEHEPGFFARPFMVGPCDVDDLGMVEQSNFIKWVEQARFEHWHQSMQGQIGEVQQLPGVQIVALEFVNPPKIGTEIITHLWEAPDHGCLVEMRDALSNTVYCRAAVDGDIPRNNDAESLSARL